MLENVQCELDQSLIHVGHYYNTPAGRLPSVTTALGATKPKGSEYTLKRWQQKVGIAVAEYIKDTSAKIGTGAHLLNENYLAGKHGLPLSSEQVDPAYMLFAWAHHANFRKFLDKIDKVYWNEGRIYSAELGIAGTVDCICEIDGVVHVADYKTKRSPQKQEWLYDAFLQTSLYALMLNELIPNLNVEKFVVVASSEHSTIQEFPGDVIDYIDKAIDRVAEFQQFVAPNDPNITIIPIEERKS